MSWNEWQAWRKEFGLLPKGERGRTVQRDEAQLHQAAMRRIYGEYWRNELAAVQEQRRTDAREGREVVRKLFPADGLSVMSSGSAAPPSERQAKRANTPSRSSELSPAQD